MKIVFLYPLRRDAYDFLKEQLPEDIEIIAKIREKYEGLRPNEDPKIIKECKDATILMGPYVTEEILEHAAPSKGGNLKLILIPWTGVDRLNFDIMKKYEIPVANSHGNARTVAEHAIALLLAAAKNLIHHYLLLRRGDWSDRFSGNYPSLNITGKTVGLLGLGAIGTECAKLLQGFNVKIIACRENPEKTTKEQKKLVEKIYSSNHLHKFLNHTDIIINSLPLTEETKGIISEEEFQQMKKEVIVVNVGRGSTIDEQALYEAVKSGKIFAAGLDPQWHYPSRSNNKDENEPTYPSKYPIHEFDNVILSPHRAADLKMGYEEAHWDDVIKNILRVYKNQEPRNLVDLKKGY
ncbi:MAG: hypothetical protein GF308_00455 [Candidatus Heimdallarchaeota archaeon]|nr:hypothetical protein [Candidatus Heimdallarchaeota archaeon]